MEKIFRKIQGKCSSIVSQRYRMFQCIIDIILYGYKLGVGVVVMSQE